MERKILFSVLLITLFLIPIITASTTYISVTTIPNYKLLIIADKVGVFPPVAIQSFAPYKNTNNSGEVNISLTTSESTVDLKLDLITASGTEVLNQNIENIPVTGEPVFIDFFPGRVNYTVGNPVVPPVINTTLTESNITNSTNTTNTPIPPIADSALNITNKTILKSNFSITGYVSKIYENNSKTFLYILVVIGIIVGILIIIFIVRKIPKRSSDHYTVSHRPLVTPSSPQNPSLIQAERKLKEAQQEIESIKRKNEEIRNAEIKLHEDSIRLERLKRGY